MRKFFTVLIVVPLGMILVIFAVANRHSVTVSFDPFNPSDPSSGVTLPLFALIIVVAILGVIAGGAATWLRQRHWRRAARRYQAEARLAQDQAIGSRSGGNAAAEHSPALLSGPR